jgi:sugar-specific transcriptional regulator TrmB
VSEGPRERALAQLQKLGLAGYESKVYTALIAADRPLTGYEVAKRSGVPRSTVYEVLGNLASKGIVSDAKTANGNQVYVGLAPHALLTRLRRDFEESITGLSVTLPALRLPVQVSTTHHISGHKLVQERALDMTDGAQFELYLTIWPEDLENLRVALRRARDRGVDASVICFGAAEPIGHFYHHRFSAPEVVLDRVGCRLTVLAADRQAVLISGTVGDDTWGVYSEDPAVVLVAVEFVRHDIAIQVLVDRVGADKVAKFWSTDKTLARLATGRGAPGLRIARPPIDIAISEADVLNRTRR